MRTTQSKRGQKRQEKGTRKSPGEEGDVEGLERRWVWAERSGQDAEKCSGLDQAGPQRMAPAATGSHRNLLSRSDMT